MTNTNQTKKHHGSCFCGDVQFEVELDATEGSRCNCTICTRLGAVGSIVKPAAFTLQSDETKLASFAPKVAVGARYFCARCHIYCFGRGDLPTLGGAFVSINLNCLDDFDVRNATVVHWDGRHNNWEAGTRPQPWPIVRDEATPA